MEGKKSRIDYLDIAKGIAILCMIAGHVGYYSLNKVVFSFHMPLFFIVSGYFLSFNTDFKTFAKKKTAQLMIPYVFTCLIIIVAAVVIHVQKFGMENVWGVLKHWVCAAAFGNGTGIVYPTVIGLIGAIWFLPALLTALCIVRYFAGQKYGTLWILLTAYVGYITFSHIVLPMSIQCGMFAAPLVYVGYLARKEGLLDKKLPAVLVVAMAALWMFCIIFMPDHVNIVINSNGGGWINMIGACCGVYIVVLASRLIDKVPVLRNILIFWGRYSLVVMCFHVIELDLGTFNAFNNYVLTCGMNMKLAYALIILTKVAWAGAWTLIAVHCKPVAKVFNVYK